MRSQLLIESLAQQEIFFLFLYEQRFWNPLIPQHRELLQKHCCLTIGIENLIKQLYEDKSHLRKGIYFPAPILRSLNESNQNLLEVASKYHYTLIDVDPEQRWRQNGKEITGKVKKLFLENLSYDPYLKRYFVEYWVDSHWDQCYLTCETSPILGMHLLDGNGQAKIQLNTGKTEPFFWDSLLVDQSERLFFQSQTWGDILLSNSIRFFVLEHLQDDGLHIKVSEKMFLLKRKFSHDC